MTAILQDDKALYSKVGSTRTFDFSVIFRDVQDLEIIRRYLVKARLILRLNADIGRAWRVVTREMGRHVVGANVNDILDATQQYVDSLERHAKVVDMLLSRLQGTKELVRVINSIEPNFMH